MNFVKFQYFALLSAIVFLLNGCVIDPYARDSETLSKMNAPLTSNIDFTTTADAGYHIVQRGETLYGISKRYGFDYHDVAAWNNIYSPYTIYPGQQLLIYTAPVVTAPVVNTLSVNQYPRVIPANYHSGISTLSYKSSNVVPLNYSGYRVTPLNYRSTYVVPSNYRATRTVPVYYSTPAVVPVTYADDSYTYTAQSKSALSVTPTTVVPISAPASNFHMVQQGENLASIAALYGLTTYDLALWNGIGSPYTLYPGQRLLIVAP